MPRKPKAKTVLVIEYDVDIQNFIARVLDLEGYGVIKSRDGKSVLEIIRENSVALVLLDLRLPGDGWSVLQEIKHDAVLAKTPVIVITAVADALHQRRVLNMGATGCLVKPMSAHSLSENIASTLRPH
jgi:DNA-binding response OmpR family regulator